MHFVQPATAMLPLGTSWFLLLLMKEFISPGYFHSVCTTRDCLIQASWVQCLTNSSFIKKSGETRRGTAHKSGADRRRLSAQREEEQSLSKLVSE